MNIDLHSHFFPIEALSNPGKYQDKAPKIELDKGKLKVTSQIGVRAGLGEGAYDAAARIKALDEMSIDLQAIFAVADLVTLLGRAGGGGALLAQAERSDWRHRQEVSASVHWFWHCAVAEHSGGHRHGSRCKEHGPKRSGNRQCRWRATAGRSDL